MSSGSDLSGRVFGSLTVMKEKHRSPDIWICRCSCGRLVNLVRSQLTREVVLHCGCKDGHPGQAVKRHIRHYIGKDGKSHEKASAELRSYLCMINRCYRKSTAGWEFYGARGIQVCARWREPKGQGFRNFLEDMGPRPENTTLDRVDANSHYFPPPQCRWATPEVQAQNKREGDEPPPRDIGDIEEELAGAA